MSELVNTYRLFFNLIFPLIVMLAAIGFISAVIRVSTQIHDRSLSFVVKFIAIFASVYLLRKSWIGDILNFTQDMWGSFKYYVN